MEDQPPETNKTTNTNSNVIIKGIPLLKNRLGIINVIGLLYACLTLITGILGMCIYGAYTKYRGPVWLRNQYIGLWLSTLLFFYSCQALHATFKNITSIKSKLFYVDFIYFIIATLCSALITICYGFVIRIDTIIWAGLLTILNVFTCVILYSRRAKTGFQGNTIKSQCAYAAFRIVNVTFKILFLIVLGFIAAGSVINGGLTLKYPPRGKFVNVQLADNSGRSLQMHYLCDGPINNSLPIFMFEGDGSHGMADYYGVQKLLKEKDRRSCIWDKPGLGYSDYMYSDMYDFSLIYHNFIKSIGEKAPFIFVGWGGGGPTVYEYATKHPEMVHSVTLLDVGPPRIEWVLPKVLKNWTDAEYDKNVKEDIAGRHNLINLINGLGVPWGLMPFFLPPSKSYPPELRSESRWFFLTEKTWITQSYFLDQLPTEPNVFTGDKLSPNITINQIMTVKNETQIIDQVCKPKKLDPTSKECQYEIESNDLYIYLRKNLTKFDNIVECRDDDCNLGYYIFDGPQFTIDTLLTLYKNDIIDDIK